MVWGKKRKRKRKKEHTLELESDSRVSDKWDLLEQPRFKEACGLGKRKHESAKDEEPLIPEWPCGHRWYEAAAMLSY